MRNRRKAVSLLTGLLVTAQLFPNRGACGRLQRVRIEQGPGYQDFPAYYSDSAHADDQVTHPDVVAWKNRGTAIAIGPFIRPT